MNPPGAAWVRRHVTPTHNHAREWSVLGLTPRLVILVGVMWRSGAGRIVAARPRAVPKPGQDCGGTGPVRCRPVNTGWLNGIGSARAPGFGRVRLLVCHVIANWRAGPALVRRFEPSVVTGMHPAQQVDTPPRAGSPWPFLCGGQDGRICVLKGRNALFETRLELRCLGYRGDLASATLSEGRCGDRPTPRLPDGAGLSSCGERASMRPPAPTRARPPVPATRDPRLWAIR